MLKMKKWKKACISFLLVILLLLTACSVSTSKGSDSTKDNKASSQSSLQSSQQSSQNNTSTVSDADNVNPAGVFPIVKEKIKLNIAVPVKEKVEDINTNKLTLWIQEKSGIDLEITQLSPNAEDAQTQINLMFTSGDIPDMIWGYYFSYATLHEFAKAGYIAPLDDYIKEYGENYYRFLDEVSVDDAEAYVTIDGHIYAMPTCTELITNIYAGYMFRYQSLFTKALGIKEPETLDEFYEMLVAFRDKDPNGNGKKDEIPMMGNAQYSQHLRVLGNCFQYTDPSTYLKVNDGVISFIGNNNLFKETIQFIKKLVDEGLFDPASFTQDAATHKTINIQDDVLVGVDTTGYYVASSYDTSMERYYTLEVMQALKGPYGYQSTPLMPVSINRALVMTTACKYPAAAYRLMDMMLSEEAAVRARIGVKGEQWDDPEEGVPGRDGRQAKYKLLTPQEWVQPSTNVIWCNEAIVYSNVMNRVAAVKDSNGYYEVGYYWGLKCQNYLSKTVTGEHLPNLLMVGDVSVEYEDLRTLITKYVTENATRFILGDRPLSEWDSYVAEFERMGLNQYISIAQEAYDAMFKK